MNADQITKRSPPPNEPMNEEDEIAMKLERIQLPRREEHKGENGDGYGVPSWCFLNVFNLSLENAPKKIYKYELTFTIIKSNGDEHTLHNAMTKVDDFVRSKKRACLLWLTRLMHEENKEFFRQQQLGTDAYWRTSCAFDCGCTYYTGVELPNQSGEFPHELWMDSAAVHSFVRSKGSIRWDLTLVEVFPIDGENAKTQQALQFFDVLSQQKLIRDGSIDVRPDAAYLHGGDQTRDHKELRKGIVTATKVMGGEVCLQLDSKISMFFQEMPLLDYIRKFTNIRTDADLQRFLFDRIASRKLRNELKNLPLRLRHLNTQKTFECKGFHDANADDTTFMMKDVEEPISVAEYFLSHYKYRLQHPQLPLVKERRGGGGGFSFHPIECLDIADGIRVSNQKMSREAQENMISKSCRAPAQLGKDLDLSRSKAGLDGNHQYMNSFNVKTKGEFAKVNGKILAKPFITGMGGIHPDINDRGQIAFTRNGFKFADPAKPSKPITLIALGNAMREDDCRTIREEFRRFGGEFGMQIDFANVRDPAIYGGQMDPLREFMASQKDRTAMFFFITKEKMDENHYMVKKLEQELGVVTQLINQQTAQQILQKKRVTEYNVVAKMNQKLGGVVANPEVPPDLKKNNPDAYARACKDWFKDRMFVGFTLSHAGAQSFADRVVGEEVREPTCVGMAFTLKQPGKRTAMSWFQEKRKAYIDDITRHFVRALDVYAESNGGKMPVSILVFRKGMSEGELKKAAYEMRQILMAIKIVSQRPGLQDYRPTLQCLVCMGNTSDRLFYNAGDANVPAGMCLDEGAAHPDRVEFLVVPHNAIKGTAKAVRCTLVHDKPGRVGRRLEYAELQLIYHTMCYLNGVAASPTRLPVPLADSEKAAERQMNLFKEMMRNGDDSMSVCSGRSFSGVTHDGSNDFYQKLSDQYAHKFKDNQYYA